MLTGNNGILTQAQNAANTTETAEIKERINLELTALYSSVLEQEIPTEFTQESVDAVKASLGTDYKVDIVIPTTGTGTAIQRVDIRHEQSSLAGYIRITDQKTVEIQYVN